MRKRLPNRGVKNYRVERYYCVNLAKEKIMANGWTGNILRVNLTTGNITSKIPVNLKVLSVAWASATKLCMTKYRQARNLSMKRIN